MGERRLQGRDDTLAGHACAMVLHPAPWQTSRHRAWWAASSWRVSAYTALLLHVGQIIGEVSNGFGRGMVENQRPDPPRRRDSGRFALA